MERQIGKFETAPAIANEYACFNLVSLLKIENAPSPEIVQNSLDILQNHHPALRTRIEKINDSYYFHSIQQPKIPLKVMALSDERQSLAEVEHYLNTPVNWRTGPLMACTFLQSPQTSELIFAFHHSIVDAVSMVSFLKDFLSLCAAQQSGQPLEEYPGYPPLPPVEDMFPDSFKGFRMQLRTFGFMARMMASEMFIILKTMGKRKPPIQVNSTSRALTMELSEEDTTGLEKAARKHKVTLNSVQHAAILSATWKYLYQSDPMPLKYILFQNLRPYLSQPVTDDVLGSYIAMLQLVVNMKPEQEFWKLCEKINQAVYQAGKSGDKFISANISGSLIKMLFRFKSFRMAVTAMNYSGTISLPETFGDIKVVDVRGFASNFGLGPEFSAQTLIFKGRLRWNIIYLESDMNREAAETITDEVKRILVEQAKEA